MKKILFMLIVLLCSMSTNAQTMKVMKGDQVVATYSSTKANEVVFGVSDGVFSMTAELGSVADFLDETYETAYPSTTVVAFHYEKKDKDVASLQYYFSDSESAKKDIDLETATSDDLKALVLEKGITYDQDRIAKINNGGFIAVWSNCTPNTEYTWILYVTSVEADEYVTIVKHTTAAEAPTTTGTAKRTGDVDVNWVQLWEDGPKFAEYNVGAENNKAEDYGGLYAWGGSQDKVDDHNTGTDALTGDNDTATKLWGTAWRMPKKEELQALLANCDVEWTDNYKESGIKGRIFTGKGGYASNSVFFPAAGYCERGNAGRQGYDSYYWSSTTLGSNYAYFLYFSSNNQVVDNLDRNYGFSVRAVLVEK